MKLIGIFEGKEKARECNSLALRALKLNQINGRRDVNGKDGLCRRIHHDHLYRRRLCEELLAALGVRR